MKEIKPVVFLGGTYVGNTSSWREMVIPRLKIGYINPEEKDTEDPYEFDSSQREAADYCLYIITPESSNFFAIAEAVQDSNIKPNNTILCIIRDCNGCYFDDATWYSMECIKKMVRDNGAIIFDTLDESIHFLNSRL